MINLVPKFHMLFEFWKSVKNWVSYELIYLLLTFSTFSSATLEKEISKTVLLAENK